MRVQAHTPTVNEEVNKFTGHGFEDGIMTQNVHYHPCETAQPFPPFVGGHPIVPPLTVNTVLRQDIDNLLLGEWDAKRHPHERTRSGGALALIHTLTLAYT